MKKILILFVCLVCLLIMAAAHPPAPFHNDNLWRIYDNGDVTKRVAFEVDGVSTGTTRTITMADADVDLGSPAFEDITTRHDLILTGGLDADVVFKDGETLRANIGIHTANHLEITSQTGTVTFLANNIYTSGDISCDDLTATGDIKCEQLTLSETTQDYLFTKLGYATTQLVLQSQTATEPCNLHFFGKTGDGSEAVMIRFWAKSIPADYTNYESFTFGYVPGETPRYELYSAQHGEGVIRPIHIWTEGNTNQFVAENDGDILMATIPGLSGKTAMVIDTATHQVGYDSSSLVYKKNIRNIEDANSCRIYGLRPIIYDCKDDSSKGIYGLVAEEVNEVMPEIVRYRVDPVRAVRKGEFGEDESYIAEWKQTNIPDGVEYNRLWAPMLKEMQKLRAEVNELQARITKLESRK